MFGGSYLNKPPSSHQPTHSSAAQAASIPIGYKLCPKCLGFKWLKRYKAIEFGYNDTIPPPQFEEYSCTECYAHGYVKTKQRKL